MHAAERRSSWSTLSCKSATFSGRLFFFFFLFFFSLGYNTGRLVCERSRRNHGASVYCSELLFFMISFQTKTVCSINVCCHGSLSSVKKKENKGCVISVGHTIEQQDCWFGSGFIQNASTSLRVGLPRPHSTLAVFAAKIPASHYSFC